MLSSSRTSLKLFYTTDWAHWSMHLCHVTCHNSPWPIYLKGDWCWNPWYTYTWYVFVVVCVGVFCTPPFWIIRVFSTPHISPCNRGLPDTSYVMLHYQNAAFVQLYCGFSQSVIKYLDTVWILQHLFGINSVSHSVLICMSDIGPVIHSFSVILAQEIIRVFFVFH